MTKKCWKSYKSTSLSVPVMNPLIIPESAGKTSFILLNSLPLLNFFERKNMYKNWASGILILPQQVSFTIPCIWCQDWLYWQYALTILGAKLALKPITVVMACSRLSLSGKKWYSCLSVTESLARQFHSYNNTTFVCYLGH